MYGPVSHIAMYVCDALASSNRSIYPVACIAGDATKIRTFECSEVLTTVKGFKRSHLRDFLVDASLNQP